MTGKEYGLMFLLNFATAILFSGVIIVGVFGRILNFGFETAKKERINRISQVAAPTVSQQVSPPLNTPIQYPMPASSPPNTSAEGMEANPYQSAEAPMETF